MSVDKEMEIDEGIDPIYMGCTACVVCGVDEGRQD